MDCLSYYETDNKYTKRSSHKNYAGKTRSHTLTCWDDLDYFWVSNFHIKSMHKYEKMTQLSRIEIVAGKYKYSQESNFFLKRWKW